MAGEIQIVTPLTGKTIIATISGRDRTKIWNGSDFVAKSSLTDAQRAAQCSISTTEQQSADGTPTPLGDYVGNWPGAITDAGEYLIQFYENTPVPANYVGMQIYTVGSTVGGIGLTDIVDGMAIEDIIKSVLAVFAGESTYDPNTRTVQFKDRSGNNVVATIVLGTSPGNRTSSTLEGE